MHTSQYNHRRHLLKAASVAGLLAAGAPALAHSFAFAPNQRYPDPAV
jgi:gluconolactonase